MGKTYSTRNILFLIVNIVKRTLISVAVVFDRQPSLECKRAEKLK